MSSLDLLGNSTTKPYLDTALLYSHNSCLYNIVTTSHPASHLKRKLDHHSLCTSPTPLPTYQSPASKTEQVLKSYTNLQFTTCNQPPNSNRDSPNQARSYLCITLICSNSLHHKPHQKVTLPKRTPCPPPFLFFPFVFVAHRKTPRIFQNFLFPPPITTYIPGVGAGFSFSASLYASLWLFILGTNKVISAIIHIPDLLSQCHCRKIRKAPPSRILFWKLAGTRNIQYPTTVPASFYKTFFRFRWQV